jgi:uroporphyrinogen-III synthase
VDYLVRAVGSEGASSLLSRVIVACIGPVTAEAALRHGVRTDVVPHEYTVTALVAALAEYFTRVARRS